MDMWTIYETATGRPLCEGAGSADKMPDAEVLKNVNNQAGVSIWRGDGDVGVDLGWIEGGQRILRADVPQAETAQSGLTVTVSAGHVFGLRHAELLAPDSYTFTAGNAGAIDVVIDDATGDVAIQPYEWDPETENKGDLPAGLTLVAENVFHAEVM